MFRVTGALALSGFILLSCVGSVCAMKRRLVVQEDSWYKFKCCVRKYRLFGKTFGSFGRRTIRYTNDNFEGVVQMKLSGEWTDYQEYLSALYARSTIEHSEHRNQYKKYVYEYSKMLKEHLPSLNEVAQNGNLLLNEREVPAFLQEPVRVYKFRLAKNLLRIKHKSWRPNEPGKNSIRKAGVEIEKLIFHCGSKYLEVQIYFPKLAEDSGATDRLMRLAKIEKVNYTKNEEEYTCNFDFDGCGGDELDLLLEILKADARPDRVNMTCPEGHNVTQVAEENCMCSSSICGKTGTAMYKCSRCDDALLCRGCTQSGITIEIGSKNKEVDRNRFANCYDRNALAKALTQLVRDDCSREGVRYSREGVRYYTTRQKL